MCAFPPKAHGWRSPRPGEAVRNEPEVITSVETSSERIAEMKKTSRDRNDGRPRMVIDSD
jgi:hypothetical protein